MAEAGLEGREVSPGAEFQSDSPTVSTGFQNVRERVASGLGLAGVRVPGVRAAWLGRKFRSCGSEALEYHLKKRSLEINHRDLSLKVQMLRE